MASSPSQQSDDPYSDDASSEYSDLGEGYWGRPYPYTPREIGAKLLNFYKFLTTLYIDPKDLHVPPEEGWPDFPEDGFEGFHTPLVREYLRHIPYITGEYQASQMSFFYDYRGIGGDQLSAGGYTHQTMKDYRANPKVKNPFHWVDTEEYWDWNTMICLSYSNGSTGTRWHTLDVLRGYIYECRVRIDYRCMDIDEFLAEWRNELDSLINIPMPYPYGNMFNGFEESEGKMHVTLEEALSDAHWEGEVSMQYVRQIYRNHGWPSQFRCHEAFAKAVAYAAKRREIAGHMTDSAAQKRYEGWDWMEY